MTGCCMPGGHVPPERTAMLARLAAMGVDLPDGAMIWGRRGDGTEWRVVTRHGMDAGIASQHPLKALADAVLVVRDGWVAPVEQPEP